MISEQPRGETSHQELEVSNVSKCLVRSISQKLKNNYHENVMDDDIRGVSLRCLSLYSRGGGCKVGAATSDDFSEVVGKGYKPVCGTNDTSVDCFSYGVERFWKRNKQKKSFEVQEPRRYEAMQVFLPDDILEMCLMRLPITSLMNTRLVCKKWRALTTTTRFMQMRRDGNYPTPWLFLFGTVKDGYRSREIYAFDLSFNKWHRIESEVLKGRFLFSVATVRDNIFIVGGCSSFFDRMDRKTHRGVLVFSPLMKSWHKVASMRHARSNPVLGVYEADSDSLTIKSQLRTRGRMGGASEVYEDPHRLSVRRLSRNEKVKHTSVKNSGRFLIMAVGGVGSWDEPLDSCEIYDSLSNKWTEIQRLPVDFGVACSAVVCKGMFYVYSESDKLAAYDVGQGSWVGVQMSGGPAAAARVQEYSAQLVSCEEEQRVFMVSVSWCEGEGEIGRRNKAVRKVWEVDVVGGSCKEVSVHPDAPMDWNAGFVGDKKKLIFGLEMFKIFGQVLEFLTVCDVSDPNIKWLHVSNNQLGRHLDASSCLIKSMAVLHL